MTSFTIVDAGDDYKVADTLMADLPAADLLTPGTGAILGFTPAGGTGLDAADGTITGVPASSSNTVSGTGATFDIEVTGGEVTDVVLNAAGMDYEMGEEIYIAFGDIQGSTTGTDLVLVIDSVDEDVLTPQPAVTVSASVGTIS